MLRANQACQFLLVNCIGLSSSSCSRPPTSTLCGQVLEDRPTARCAVASRGLGSLPPTAPCIVYGHVATFFPITSGEDDFWMWNFISRNLQEPKILWQPIARAQGQRYFLTLK